MKQPKSTSASDKNSDLESAYITLVTKWTKFKRKSRSSELFESSADDCEIMTADPEPITDEVKQRQVNIDHAISIWDAPLSPQAFV